MIAVLLCVVLVLEVIVGLFVLNLYRQKTDHEPLLEDIAIANNALKDLQQTVHSELVSLERNARELLKNLNQVSTEIEVEIKNSKETIASNLDEIVAAMAKKIEIPLHNLAKKENSVEVILRKVEKEKDLLLNTIGRAQNLAMFFNEKIPYNDLMKEIEHKKYDDARRMFTQGHSKTRIQKDLNLSAGEIDLIVGMVKP